MAALLLFQPLAAQTVDLRVLDDSTRHPVAGAIARLQDGSGKVVAQGLTSEAGRILLKAPVAGTYRVRADAIGFRGRLGEATRLAPGDPVRIEIGITREPPMLPTLVVTADSRCDSRPGQGTLAGILWEDIKKALTAERLTQASQQEPLTVTLFERQLNVREVLLRETVVGTRLTSGQPFASLPPEDLARRGFVRTIADTESYAGPDAALLLSEAFVGTHCFRAQVPSGAQSPLLGLAFEPTRDRTVSDIRGVLWMDRESRELRHIEYWYTGLRGAAAGSRAGGRIEFRRLPRGTWIVGYWYVRMPNVAKIVRGDLIPTGRDSLLGYLDRGGRADLIQASAAITNQPLPAVLSGTVYDSLDSRGLAGAVVRVGGLADSVVTDSTGAFRLETREAGARLVIVQHPRLGLVADRSSQEVVLRAGEEVRIDVAVPAIDAFVRVFCLGEHADGARLVGQAFDERGAAAEGLAVRVSWLMGVSSGRVVRYENLTTASGARGIYAHCDIPTTRMVTVQLIRGVAILAELHTTLAARESRWMDLRTVPR